MTVNFYLDSNPNKKSLHTLYCYIRQVNDIPVIKINTGHKFLADDWNVNKQRCKTRNKHHQVINQSLITFRDAATLTYNNLINQKSITKELFIEKFNSIINGESSKISIHTFSDVFREYVEIKKPTISESYTKKLFTLLRHLEEFANKSKLRLDFDNFSNDFFIKFTNYLIQVCNQTNNTINKLTGYLKTFLKWAMERKYHSNTEYEKFSFKSYETEVISLSSRELEALLNVDLTAKPHLIYARDFFIFSCHTGQRYSDVSKLSVEQVTETDGTYFWNLRTEKTREIVKIRLTTVAFEIFKRYFIEGNGFPKLYNQKLNIKIKEIAKIAGITSEITTHKYSGSKHIVEVYPKYELITSHVARKTFVTLSLERGMRVETVMKITGHKDFKTFKKYLRVVDSARDAEFAQAWD